MATRVRPGKEDARDNIVRRSLGFLRGYLQTEAASGLLLLAIVVAAIGVANSPLGPLYHGVLETPIEFRIGTLAFDEPLVLWIDDGLMAIFFLVVAMEIKREVLEGELSKIRQLALPGLAAVGGMVVPAVLYVAVNDLAPHGIADGVSSIGTLRGWAIPAATDIAFAVGALSLAGKRVPSSLRVFLLALAILDDLGAIVIIACFYSGSLVAWALVATACAMLALLLLNRLRVQRITPYALIGIVTWFAMLRSGLHPTLAGVALAFAIPLRPPGKAEHGHGSPLKRLEKSLHGWVAYGIVPLFGFANAGLVFGDVGWRTFAEPVPLGVLIGLCIGKPIGVFSAAWLATRFGVAAWPAGARTIQLFGVAVLCGIGFTMSLFIGQLAFTAEALRTQMRLGVFTASLLAGLVGFAILRFSRAGSAGRRIQRLISTTASTSTETPQGSEPTPMALRA